MKEMEINLQNVGGTLKSSKWIEFVDYFYMSSLKIWLDKGFVHWVYLYTVKKFRASGKATCQVLNGIKEGRKKNVRSQIFGELFLLVLGQLAVYPLKPF